MASGCLGAGSGVLGGSEGSDPRSGMVVLRPDDPRLGWEGAVSLQRTKDWVQPWRGPFETIDLFCGLKNQLAMSTGVRIVFYSDAVRVGGAAEPAEKPRKIDVVCDGKLIETLDIDERGRFLSSAMPEGMKLIELWLPVFTEFRLKELRVSAGAKAVAVRDRRPRWVVYGGSNSQCKRADSPAQTWPAIVARALDLHLTCLGVGGNCHYEPMVARMIRDRPADFVTIYAGQNVWAQASLSRRTHRPALIGFFRIIRERHPDAPILIITSIYSTRPTDKKNKLGLTLDDLNADREKAIAVLQAHGDKNIRIIDGRKIYGADLAHLMADGLHPNGEGYKIMADRVLKLIEDWYPDLYARKDKDTSAERSAVQSR
jgi:lysophospholipase L1-like esterase